MEIWEREDFCGLWCVWEPSTHLGCMRLDVGIVGDRLRCMGPSVKSGELGGCERLVCGGGGLCRSLGTICGHPECVETVFGHLVFGGSFFAHLRNLGII